MNATGEKSTSATHFTRDMAQNAFAHVLGKRTYGIGPNGGLTLLPDQLALVDELVAHDEDGPVRWEPDFFACASHGCDVVVQGAAHASSGRCRQLEVSVAVQRTNGTAAEAEAKARRVSVFGDRSVLSSSGVHPKFSEPEEFDSMPLTYARAYGGHDVDADRTHPEEMAVLLAEDAGVAPSEFFQNTYPRNRKGRGYLLYGSQEAFERVALPNVELAHDRLTPSRLVVNGEQHWHRAPFPAGFDWYGQENFPRSAFFGVCPEFAGSPADLLEVSNGFLPEELARGSFFENVVNAHAQRIFRGATPWLMFPDFEGDEVIRIRNMHPTRTHIEVPMPREKPEMVLELFGRARQTLTPRLRRVVVQPDQERVIVVWVGSIPLDRMPTPSYIEKARHAVRWT
jgi:hypothetical protein